MAHCHPFAYQAGHALVQVEDAVVLDIAAGAHLNGG